MLINAKNAKVQSLNDNLFSEKKVTVSVLRLDKIHPYISGNKWYKLKYNLEEFNRQEKKFLLTMGGAFSNHILAVAAAGNKYGIATIGIIRGEELNENSNTILKRASYFGMKFIFVTRDEYRKIRFSGVASFNLPEHISADEIYFIPEGGSNPLAVKGCADIVQETEEDFDVIACACGTGTTLAGLSSAVSGHQSVIGISVVSGENFLKQQIIEMNGNKNNFSLFNDYVFGGYANKSAMLENFCSEFFQKHGIQIESVYTGRFFFGLYDLIRKDKFIPGTRLLALHTGGVYVD